MQRRTVSCSGLEVPVQERRAQRTHPEYKKPELMATAPNQVWSWDITRLLERHHLTSWAVSPWPASMQAPGPGCCCTEQTRT